MVRLWGLFRLNLLLSLLTNLPADVIKHYDLNAKVTTDGYVYVDIRRGMYRLPQAGLIAQKLLEEHLNKEGYSQSEHTPGLWTHKWCPTTFSLCVDDFGVKYVGKEHADHLMSVLQAHYVVSSDWMTGPESATSVLNSIGITPSARFTSPCSPTS